MTPALFPEMATWPARSIIPTATGTGRRWLDLAVGHHDSSKHGVPAPTSVLGPRQPWVYRSLVARELGRPLRPHEIVHHINGDYTDNRLDNLMLLSSQGAHMLLHAFWRRRARGQKSMFPWEQLLRFSGEHVIWVNHVGYATATELYD